MWVRKLLQCAWPIVCAPESAIMSRGLNPLAANDVTRSEKLPPGAGRFAVAACRLVVLASLRPRYTAQYGPPSCKSRLIFQTHRTKLRCKTIFMKNHPIQYQCNAIPGGKGKDIGARHGAPAAGLHTRLDGVYDLEAAQ